MNRHLATFIMVAAVAGGAPYTVLSAQEESTSSAEFFLKKAAEAQQLEVALGRLASEKASHPQVKQFGSKMIEDHHKAGQEVQQLAAHEGIQLPKQLSEKQKEKRQQFAKLSGKDFDRAYMMHMLRDHLKDVTRFEEGAQAIQDPQVQQWAAGSLPILKEHLQQAQQIAAAIGIQPTDSR